MVPGQYLDRLFGARKGRRRTTNPRVGDPLHGSKQSENELGLLHAIKCQVLAIIRITVLSSGRHTDRRLVTGSWLGMRGELGFVPTAIRYPKLFLDYVDSWLDPPSFAICHGPLRRSLSYDGVV
ncbi:hypothetical protein CCM_09585 [Cordyceps militaris CM01]|uniref:Uncharacterized protein n=1 Tax=Cordyceps militaris (strain CM01) TaxID=983644 RepID=G3JUU4_CORMM|nr:uncharacterized protein CCM_09585 [Cordyceps militaris CM01]EGX87624.1 hypothetical protein CCM_09585 [Cordyceps militaris CM01]